MLNKVLAHQKKEFYTEIVVTLCASFSHAALQRVLSHPREREAQDTRPPMLPTKNLHTRLTIWYSEKKR